jgi:two-component system, NtrC family, response regulator GlrR
VGRTILFVDDDKICRVRIEDRLKGAGYEVVLAADATEAMALQHDVKLDAIVLDMNLDGEDGRVLMKFLKRNDPGVPIILYTCEEHDFSEVAAVMQQGAYRYVRKGSDDDLLDAIQKALHHTSG